jgi:hypothetical protein
MSSLGLMANNIQVGNVTLTGQNTVNDTWQVQFNIGWENSWRTSTAEANYDAAWIFLKFRANSGPWTHALLSNAGHVAPTGGTLSATADGMGAFLFRSADGLSDVNYAGAQVCWNYGASGVADAALIEIRVLAIEMVFIPSGAFYLGDGTMTQIAAQFEQGQTGAPYHVTSEGAITLGGSSSGNLNCHNDVGTGLAADFSYSEERPLPAAYPKGFNAFYVMKYETSEGQYVDFLNMLTPAQAANLFPDQTGLFGHTIDDTGIPPEIYVTAAPERTCGALCPESIQAYADWAGMRPMSDFEFEKVCRGPLSAVANEYAWGTNTLSATTIALSNAGTANETVSPVGSGGVANSNLVTTGVPAAQRPWRTGIVSGSSVGPTRVQASAGYYGVMELSGNLDEVVVNVGSSTGRTLDRAVHGNGALNASGAADVPSWPTYYAAFLRRGGDYSTTPAITQRLRVSDRSIPVTNYNTPDATSGCRLVRMP